MLWSDLKARRRLTGAALIAGLLLLGACGFRPLYGTGADGSSAFDDLETVQVAPLPDRTGQRLHNLLRDRINPRGQPQAPRYVLQISLSEDLENLAIEQDETATRANLKLTARFRLRSVEGDEIVFRGVSNSVNSYNIVDSQFATFVSQRDARDRALRELSEDIRLRLATYFTRLKAEAES